MKELDPGHIYQLHVLDGESSKCEDETLTFVKREGAKYPGNKGSYPGTNLQECWRAEIARLKYLDKQDHHECNMFAITNLRLCIFSLEKRAAERHGTTFSSSRIISIEDMPICPKCGHIFNHTHEGE